MGDIAQANWDRHDIALAVNIDRDQDVEGGRSLALGVFAARSKATVDVGALPRQCWDHRQCISTKLFLVYVAAVGGGSTGVCDHEGERLGHVASPGIGVTDVRGNAGCRSLRPLGGADEEGGRLGKEPIDAEEVACWVY